MELLDVRVEILRGMRHGCVGVVEAMHSEVEFKIRFQDGRYSYFLASEFKVLE